MSGAELQAYEKLLAQPTGFATKTSLSTSIVSADLNLNGTWGGVSERLKGGGGAWITVEAPAGSNVYVMAKAAGDATAATAATGTPVYAGTTDDFYVSAATPLLAILGTATSTTYVNFSSRNLVAS